ncbi:hypothetical protein [Chitinophaga sancti]|uniref:Uncharacterized protein n=1 Tax=Chitinophaga sancti TaxID=1004 RepID=A0A1K1LQA0_9BACT|nr:hypothetical protein [Chitinophaga sancti]WQD64933.1 hypothetical protein U0033_11060 [Chitinophaga sancti]WQG89443.1 hypothetical protein SR876_31410 [Chitinophaga sancti]SFW13052.1 hypothetical protein SAMN05661012_00128 [Chitinophaga sancti]
MGDHLNSIKQAAGRSGYKEGNNPYHLLFALKNLKRGIFKPYQLAVKKRDNPQITRRYPAYKPPLTRILKEAAYLRVITSL